MGYVEDDVQIPILTPSAMLYGQPTISYKRRRQKLFKDVNLKCAKYLKQPKDVLWSRWTTEYLKALRQHHNLKSRTGEATVNPGNVVLIKGGEHNGGRWRFSIVEQLIQGTDGMGRGARLRARNSYLE